jgi:hypothetical protein
VIYMKACFIQVKNKHNNHTSRPNRHKHLKMLTKAFLEISKIAGRCDEQYAGDTMTHGNYRSYLAGSLQFKLQPAEGSLTQWKGN